MMTENLLGICIGNRCLSGYKLVQREGLVVRTKSNNRYRHHEVVSAWS